MKIFKRVLIGFIAFIAVIMIGFSIWAYTPAKPMPQAFDSVKSAEVMTIGNGKTLVFTPVSGEAMTGLIFYPGGRVDYRAYAPMGEALAEKGYLVIIPQMPFNLAVFGSNRAEAIIHQYPNVNHWVIGGHSLGGSMAAHYLFENQQAMNGLLLVASYPAGSDDLTDYFGKVTSVSGSLDGLATPADINASRALLPSTTTFFEIQGGDHAQFGWYGEQAGDNPAEISREEQQQELVNSILELLSSVAK